MLILDAQVLARLLNLGLSLEGARDGPHRYGIWSLKDWVLPCKISLQFPSPVLVFFSFAVKGEDTNGKSSDDPRKTLQHWPFTGIMEQIS